MWQYDPVEGMWETCVQPYSFYHDFIEDYWAGGPSETTAAPIHRLCTLARKMGVKSFILEDGFERREIINEVAHLEAVSGMLHGDLTAQGVKRAVIVTFLSCEQKDVGDLKSDDVIGQAVIITFPDWNRKTEKVQPRSYIYEAIVRLPSMGPAKQQLLNNYVPISRVFDVYVRSRHLNIPSSYFCQQNGVTSICGHCAVRTLVRSRTDRNATIPLLNEKWNFTDSFKVKVDDIRDALREYGLETRKYRLDRRPPEEGETAAFGGEQSDLRRNSGAPTFIEGSTEVHDATSASADGGDATTEEVTCTPEEIWHALSLMADSAVPSLLILSSGRPLPDHVVPLLGHTFNSDEWHPIGVEMHQHGDDTAAPSTLWIDHLVIHDDVLGPYYCLSRGGLFPGHPDPDSGALQSAQPDAEFPSAQREEVTVGLSANGAPARRITPKQLLAVLPRAIERSPIHADNYARGIMRHVESEIVGWGKAHGKWWEYYLKCYERRVFRTTLVKSHDYMKTLRGYDDEDGKPVTYVLDEKQKELIALLGKRLPEHFWLAEITLPNLLLANRAKLGELLINPEEIPIDEDVARSLYAFRMPSVLGLAYVDVDGTRKFGMSPWPEIGHRSILRERHSHRW